MAFCLQMIALTQIYLVSGSEAGEVPFDFVDTVLDGEQPLPEEALQHGAHAGPVDQLQHEQVRLQNKNNVMKI